MKSSDIRFGYSIQPIDFGFRYLHTVDAFRDLVRLEDLDRAIGLPLEMRELEAFERNLEAAKSLAKDLFWEGDFREGPFVFAIPGDLEMRYGFLWKQDNNGTTFVLSPEPLPYLEKLA
jgi:hypothetical protein